MELEKLKEIGLTKGEIKVYNALIETGETTRTELAKKSGVTPSKIYDVANRLQKKGIISTVKKQGVLHFKAANPEKLKEYIRQKEEELNKEKEIVNKILPSLKSKYNQSKEDVNIEVFYGWQGLKTVYKDIVNKMEPGNENCILGASKGENSNQADIFFSWYYSQVNKKGYKQRIIFNENLRGNKARTQHFYKDPHEIRYLHQDTFTEINLYKNSVLFVMLLKKPIVIRIESREAADSFKKYFETMWELAAP